MIYFNHMLNRILGPHISPFSNCTVTSKSIYP